MSHHSAHACAEGGFVRFPRSYLHLPISPGAKVVLMHLCGAANDDGESWYCYEDIAELVGRSKASITAYVNELVALDLVSSIRQTMANGYNYRRRLKIVGWKDLVAYWASLSKAPSVSARGRGAPTGDARAGREARSGQSKTGDPALSGEPGGLDTVDAPSPSGSGSATVSRPAAARAPDYAASGQPSRGERLDFADRDPERSIQPVKRTDPSGLKTNIHQNKTPRRLAPSAVWTEDDEMAWRRFRPSDRDPITACNKPLNETLATRVRNAEKALEEQLGLISREDRRSLVFSRVTAFASRHGLSAEQAEIAACATAICRHSQTRADIDAMMDALEQAWKPHWKKLSSPGQIATLAGSLAPTARDKDLMALLATLRNRAWICGFHLDPGARSGATL